MSLLKQKLVWLLFGQLLGNIQQLFIATSVHTEFTSTIDSKSNNDVSGRKNRLERINYWIHKSHLIKTVITSNLFSCAFPGLFSLFSPSKCGLNSLKLYIKIADDQNRTADFQCWKRLEHLFTEDCTNRHSIKLQGPNKFGLNAAKGR